MDLSSLSLLKLSAAAQLHASIIVIVVIFGDTTTGDCNQIRAKPFFGVLHTAITIVVWEACYIYIWGNCKVYYVCITVNNLKDITSRPPIFLGGAGIDGLC